MKESDVRRVGEEQGRLLPDAPAAGREEVPNPTDPAKHKAEDEWLDFATEDPAFFIKPSDSV